MSQAISGTHARNLNDTGQNISNGVCHIAKILALNTSGAAAFVQVFDSPAASVTLGTTRPLFVIALAATTGFEFLDFNEPGLYFTSRFSAFSTTSAEGNTGSGAGVFLQGFIN